MGFYRERTAERPEAPPHGGPLQGLADLSVALRSLRSLPQALDRINLEARRLIGAHQSVITLSVGGRAAQLIAAVSLSEKYAAWRDYRTRPDGSEISRLLAQGNSPMRLTQDELEAHSAWRAFGGEAGSHPPMRGWLAAPLVTLDGRNVGIIQLSDKYEGEFTEDDEAIIVQLAQLASASIERVDLLDRIRRQAAEVEQRVIERTAELESANRELDAFTRSVSHDLRAPLRRIDHFARALREDCSDGLDDTGLHYLERLEVAAASMGETIEGLLILSRVTNTSLERGAVDLGEQASSIVAELYGAGPKRDVEVIIPRGLVAHGDARLLRIALENLLGNAWKYTAKRARPRIELGVLGLPDEPIYFVRDNGAGFDMEHATRLFRPFERLHSSREFPGSGLGLATVRQIIERHGGRVWAESRVDQGATFYFVL